MTEKSLRELDLPALARRRFTPSPAAWEDQVLYFLMLDRFSDGREQGYRGNDGQPVSGGSTPLFQTADAKTPFRARPTPPAGAMPGRAGPAAR